MRTIPHEAGTCHPATGQCSDPTKANGSPCDDADACTQTDSCIDGSHRIQVAELWREYCEKAAPSARKSRTCKLTVAYALLGGFLVLAFDIPKFPYRGAASLFAIRATLLFAVLMFIYLMMLVLDASQLCVELIKRLSAGERPSRWPEKTVEWFGPNQGEGRLPAVARLREELVGKYHHIDDWIDIQFIATHTEAVGKLIYYPFVLLALMIFALSKVFDNWEVPAGLMLVFLLNAGIILASAIRLQRAAERARRATIRRLKETLQDVRWRQDEAARTLERQLSEAGKEIQSLREGAFLPLVQQPAVQALFLPFGGWGGLALLQHFLLKAF